MRKRAFTLLELVISVSIASLALVGVGVRVHAFVTNKRFQKSVETVKMRLDMASKLARMSRNIAQVEIAEKKEGRWTISFGLVCLPPKCHEILKALEPEETLDGVREIAFSDGGQKKMRIEFDGSEVEVPGQTLTLFQKGGDGEESISVNDYVAEKGSEGDRGFPTEALNKGD